MYMWRYSIAIILGFVWCFSENGRVFAQIALGFLCFLPTPHIFKATGQESSSQTDEVTEKELLQETTEGEHLCNRDETDKERNESQESQYPHIKKSLMQVFECFYAQLILPWYSVPEPSDSQPLHQVLWREFDCIFDRIIDRAKDFDVSAASVGCIRILTQHLHNAKKSDRVPMFNSREEEVAFLRQFSEVLVQNIFPDSLLGLDVNRCALKEIIAVKGLKLLVTWLSDPDNLNQLVVSQLDVETPRSSVEDLCESDPDRASPASRQSLDSVGVGDATENSQAFDSKSKRKANKLKEGWSKFIDKMKTKKLRKKNEKKVKPELMFSVLNAKYCLASDGEAKSREGSIPSQQNSDDEESDLEGVYTSVQEDMIEFKLSYEMWRASHWAVSVPHVVWDNNELCFTIHLEESNNPENLQWDVRKSQTDVIYFRNRWQDSAHLPSLFVLEDGERRTDGEEMEEKARTSLELFLQELISDGVIGHSQPVFQFLCPLDRLLNEEVYYGGVWGLVSGLAYFLTPGQEEEEQNNHRVEAGKEDVPGSESLPAADTENDFSAKMTGASPPAIIISECSPPSESSVGEEEDEAKEEEEEEEEKEEKESEPPVKSHSLNSVDSSDEKDQDLKSRKRIIKRLSRSEDSLVFTNTTPQEDKVNLDCKVNFSYNSGSLRDISGTPLWRTLGGKSNKAKEKMSPFILGGIARFKGTLAKEEESQSLKRDKTNWDQLGATKALFDLLKEISGNSFIINLFDAVLKPVMHLIKKCVNSFLKKMNPTEAQMASYIDNLREKHWPGGSPAAPSPPRSPEEKAETRDQAHHLISARYSNYFILKKSDVETVFKIFQDSEENKNLVYVLLSFLLRELLPGEDALNVSATALRTLTAK